MKLHIILLIAVAIIMISGIIAEETASSKEVVPIASSTEVVPEKVVSTKITPVFITLLQKLSKIWPSLTRYIKISMYHIMDVITILFLNGVFDVAWEETYDYLFGIYGMQSIPYFPIP